MNVQGAMKSLGEVGGVRWFWAEPGLFTVPGVYYWDGNANVHVTATRAATGGLERIESAPFYWEQGGGVKQDAATGYCNGWNDCITAIEATRAATVPQGVLDSARLDAIETEISEGGPIVLHNGEGTGGKHRGLGMANTGRTLRQAIDEMCDLNAALAPPPAELGKGKES